MPTNKAEGVKHFVSPDVTIAKLGSNPTGPRQLGGSTPFKTHGPTRTANPVKAKHGDERAKRARLSEA